jgi:hypothetical protein
MREQKCIICNKSTDDKKTLCILHQLSLWNLENAHKHWQIAYGTAIPPNQFLHEIIAYKETGKEAKKVAKQILANKIRWSTKQ